MSLRTPTLTTSPDIPAEAMALSVKAAATAKITAIFMCIPFIILFRVVITGLDGPLTASVCQSWAVDITSDGSFP